MRPLLRSLTINAVSLYLLTRILPGVTISSGLRGLVLTTLLLTLLTYLAKPILSLLFLPLNLIALGAFRWLINVLILFLLSWLSPDFAISASTFNQFYLTPFLTIVVASFLFQLTSSLLRWFID